MVNKDPSSNKETRSRSFPVGISLLIPHFLVQVTTKFVWATGYKWVQMGRWRMELAQDRYREDFAHKLFLKS